MASGALPRSVGLVPTMGALHEGHLSLVDVAKGENDVVAASIFVNPKQFSAHEDLGSYPRTLDADVAALASRGAHYVFAPAADEMYPPGRPALLSPFIDLEGVDVTTAEGSARPQFFRGVATVVAKLLNITQPRTVYFGQKDGMQCVVVRRLIEDLNFPTRLVVAPTVRETDGLAMSSRNTYLAPPERAAAPIVFAALQSVAAAHASGERRSAALVAAAATTVAVEPLAKLEYLSLSSNIDASEVAADGKLAGPTLASIAVRIGTTRLIDNVILEE